MKKIFLPCLLVACTAGILAVTDRPAPVEQAVANDIDFVALRQQADRALENLQQKRVASNAIAPF